MTLARPDLVGQHGHLMADVFQAFASKGANPLGIRSAFPNLTSYLADYAHDRLIELPSGKCYFLDAKSLERKDTGNFTVSVSSALHWEELFNETGVRVLICSENGKCDYHDYVLDNCIGWGFKYRKKGAEPLKSSQVKPFWVCSLDVLRHRWE